MCDTLLESIQFILNQETALKISGSEDVLGSPKEASREQGTQLEDMRRNCKSGAWHC